MMDYSNLSKEELIKIIMKQENKIKDQELEIETLKAERKELNIEFNKLIAKYEAKVEMSKKVQVEKFMSKSEKIIINEVDKQKEKTKRKTPTENFIKELKELASNTLIFDYDFEGNEVNRKDVREFGFDESYKIEINPVSIDIVKIVRPKYKDKDHIYQAISDDVFPHSVLTPSLAANIITMKYELGVPLNRYSDYLIKHGLNISVYNLSNYVSRSMELLSPIYEKMIESLFNNNAKSLHADETTLEVLESSKEKCYMFVYTTSFWDDPVYIYEFSESRKTINFKKHLEQYKGYITVDGYGGYDSIASDEIKIQRCMIHARRYFMDCLKPLREQQKKKSPAYKVVELMGKLFSEEEKFRKEKLTADEIKEKRNSKEYLENINKLNNFIESIECMSGTLLNKAVNYYKNNKKELYTYLEDGHVDMHNNLAERTIRPFTVARKSFLFCKTVDGAEVTAKAFSIVQTARANGLIVEKYLKYVLENIKKVNLTSLLPWSEDLPKDIKISN